MRAFLNRVFGGRPYGPDPSRDQGKPTSPNGASSFHLEWLPRKHEFDAVSATLTVEEPPRTNDLYFFALQASFRDGLTEEGGAHVGLQWNSRHPGNRAANWGGYWSQSRGGQILPGTDSTLPSTPNDPNTRDYRWQPATPYRLQIEPGSRPGWWLGSVTNLADGDKTPIRELKAGGMTLSRPLVWSEVFAHCDAPSVTVSWSNLAIRDRTGAWIPVTRVTARYQSYDQGGCSNTTSLVEGGRFVQSTSTVRRVHAGETLTINT